MFPCQPPPLFRCTQVLLGVCLVLFLGLPSHARGAPGAPGSANLRQYLPAVAHNHYPPWYWQPSSPTLTAAPRPTLNSVPIAVIDKQGRAHLFWSIDSWAPEPRFVYHAILTLTGWTTPLPVRTALGASYSPFAPAVGSDGAIHLLWLNKLTSDSSPRLLYSSFANGAWTPEQTAFSYPQNTNYPQASLQLTESGRTFAVVRYSAYDSSVVHVERLASGWRARELPALDFMAVDHWALGDRAGGVLRIHSVFDWQNYQGYFSYWIDGTYRVQDRRLSFAPNGRLAQLDADSNLHVYWTAEVPVPGGHVQGLYQQCFDPQMNVVTPPVLLSGSEAMSDDVFASPGDSGRWTLSWYAPAAQQIRVGIWQGCHYLATVSLPAQSDTRWPPQQVLYREKPDSWCGIWKTGTNGYHVRCAGPTEWQN